MAYDFPASPSVGQKYPTVPVVGQPTYVWDGEKWKIDAAGASLIYVSDTPPAAASDNALWWESDSGLLWLKYNDGSSSQWVVAAPQPDFSTYVATLPQSLTAPQQQQARANVYAAPFDALAYDGIQVNGAFDVSQEWGYTAMTAGAGFIADGWAIYRPGTMVTSCLRSYSTTTAFPGHNNFMTISTTTAQASLGASDGAQIYQGIEGYRIARLQWGTANAQSMTVAFYSSHFRTGIYSVVIRNYDGTRSYATTYTHASANAVQLNVITIPGCTTGTWNADNSGAMYIIFCIASGTASIAPSANTWLNANYSAAPGQVNGTGATSDIFRITGLVMLPGNEMPSADRFPYLRRPFDYELNLCKRYYQRYPSYLVLSSAQVTTVFPVAFRTTPTVTGGGAGFTAYINSVLGIFFQTAPNYNDLVLDARV